MAINLATKYSDKIATVFTSGSFVAGKTSARYNFTGVKTLKIYTPQTVAEGDYSRSGTNRYGTPTEMEDIVQEMSMTQDKSFSLVIDKGNNQEQMMIKNTGEMLGLQLKEQTIPTADKYAIGRYVANAGKIASVANALTKTTVTDAIMDADVHFSDHSVPLENRFLYVTAATFKLIKMSPEFLGIEALGRKILEKGECGEINGFRVIKVPSSYLPANCYFLAVYKESVLFPYKINDAKIHKDPPGISGALLEGRHNYDAFVLGARCNGVYACVLAASKLATPTVTEGVLKYTIAGDNATSCKYTTDGSDPRYSDTANTVTGTGSFEIAAAAGEYRVKAVCYAADKFASDVVDDTITVTAE